MCTVSLSHLSRTARKALEDWGPVNVGSLLAGELSGLWDALIEIDEVENLKADPEIRVRARRERLIIRTSQSRLFVQNAGHLAEPSDVLAVGAHLAELDGSAAARRTAPPVAGSTTSSSRERHRPRIPRVRRKLGRCRCPARIRACLRSRGSRSCSLPIPPWVNRRTRPAAIRPGQMPLTTVERLAEEAALTGVDTTGSEPGEHGRVLVGDEKLKRFQTNGQAAPGVIFGADRHGRIDGNPCLTCDQPGGLIQVRGRECLVFCGKIDQRVPEGPARRSTVPTPSATPSPARVHFGRRGRRRLRAGPRDHHVDHPVAAGVGQSRP